MTQEQHQNHAGIPLYVIFCVILGVITALEWGIFKYREPWGVSNAVLIGALAVMSLVKFVMVVGWYMHLRYDPKLLKLVFIFSFLLICSIAGGLIVLMTHHGV